MYLGDGPDSKRVTGAEVTAEWSDDGLTVKITVDGGGEPLSVEGFDVAVNWEHEDGTNIWDYLDGVPNG